MYNEIWKGGIHSSISTVRKMVIELTYCLNKGNDKNYTYLENGFVKATVKNLSKNTISIFKVFIRFKNSRVTKKFTENCDVKINPNESSNLPQLNFTIDLWANNWSNFYNIGIRFRELRNDNWSTLKAYVRKPSDYLLVNNAPSQNKKIFISHSNSERDKNIVSKMNDFLVKIGFTPYIAERNPQLNQHLWKKIHKELVECEKIVVLYTRDGVKSGDIREEVGITVGLNKKDQIVAIVENGSSPPGTILGQEYIQLNFNNVDDSILRTANYILGKKDEAK